MQDFVSVVSSGPKSGRVAGLCRCHQMSTITAISMMGLLLLWKDIAI
jgi:hypothetical protein